MNDADKMTQAIDQMNYWFAECCRLFALINDAYERRDWRTHRKLRNQHEIAHARYKKETEIFRK